jgi:hypothetical protein
MGCYGTGAPHPGSVDLNGSWNLTLSGVSGLFAFTQKADSLNGTAAYSMNSGNPPGCGGESLPSAGTVSLSGQVTGIEIRGRMSFDGRWTPPFNASIASKDTIRGNLMSVDRGGCAFILVRKRGN